MKLIKYLIFTALLFVLPIQSLAHEGEEHVEQSGVMGNVFTYGLITSIVLFVLTLSLWFLTSKKFKRLNVKNKNDREIKERLGRFSKIYLSLTVLMFVLALVTGIATANQKANKEGSGQVTLTHIHGLGYTADGSEIYVPAHDGLKVYHDDGHWTDAQGAKHDYMGFSMVDFGFYSSGHPAPGSDMKNPFGVLKSEDMGKSLETLDLYGEIDFHGMAVGYKSHAIYVLNPEPNSRMEQTGLYYTLDETKTWVGSAMEGLEGQPAAIAVHPTKENVVAIGSNSGLYLSNDYGQTFSNILSGSPTTAVQFDHDGNLFAGSVTNEDNYKVKLYQINVETNEKVEMNSPEFQQEDAISYITVNPTDNQEVAVATFKKDIFITSNQGESWTKIVDNGTALSQQGQEVTANEDHKSHDAAKDEAHEHGITNKEDLPLNVVWNYKDEPAEKQKQLLEIHVMDQEGNAIKDFEVEHEKLMHLIVVSKDLSVFQHLHPEYNGDGVFRIDTEFPKGGEYKLIADVVPSGYSKSTVTQWIDVTGNNVEEEIVADENLTKVINDKEVSLEFDQLDVKKEVQFSFTLKDVSSGEPITNLQPYLGAIGHVVIVSEDGEEYLHSHPINNAESGPEAKFMTQFPKEGTYKIWGQFKINDEIVTVPFVVKV